jgi:2-keto-3-deoxy-L-rhamnonate aldolase RhmA
MAEGIDVLFARPWNLDNNLVYPVTGEFVPELKSAMATILEVAKVNGKKARIYCGGRAMTKMYAHHCINMVRFTHSDSPCELCD